MEILVTIAKQCIDAGRMNYNFIEPVKLNHMENEKPEEIFYPPDYQISIVKQAVMNIKSVDNEKNIRKQVILWH